MCLSGTVFVSFILWHKGFYGKPIHSVAMLCDRRHINTHCLLAVYMENPCLAFLKTLNNVSSTSHSKRTRMEFKFHECCIFPCHWFWANGFLYLMQMPHRNSIRILAAFSLFLRNMIFKWAPHLGEALIGCCITPQYFISSG